MSITSEMIFIVLALVICYFCNKRRRKTCKSVYSKDGVNITINGQKKSANTVWILIKGYTKPRKYVLKADLRKTSIHWLPYLTADINIISKKIQETDDHHCFMKIEITPSSKEFTTEKLMNLIGKASEYANKYCKRLIIYFTGHGQDKSGNWILNHGSSLDVYHKNISFKEVLESIKSIFSSNNTVTEIRFICDCCYSYKWVKKLVDFQEDRMLKDSNITLHVLASAQPKEYGGSGYAKDRFSPWLCLESEEGICYHGIVNKHTLSMKYWVNSKMISDKSDAQSDGEMAVDTKPPNYIWDSKPIISKAVQSDKLNFTKSRGRTQTFKNNGNIKQMGNPLPLKRSPRTNNLYCIPNNDRYYVPNNDRYPWGPSQSNSLRQYHQRTQDANFNPKQSQ